jgi:two-component system chemotaxis response regulator CheY
MIALKDKRAEEYLAVCREHLNAIEAGLLSLDKGGPESEADLVEDVLQTMHALGAGAGYCDLAKVTELAQQAEKVLGLFRAHKLAPTPDGVGLLLNATDRMREMFQYAGTSHQTDSSEVLTALERLLSAYRPILAAGQLDQPGGQLKMLLVEDDFASRLVLQTFLSRYGECHVAVNGREAVDAVRAALKGARRYDLICMDIMMPEMDGHEAVRQIRALEERDGILWCSGAKIIMTTAVDNIKEVFKCFSELCDAYLVKPIDLSELVGKMKSYRLIQ